MKYILLLIALVAINLPVADPAFAQKPDAIPDAPRTETLPRTKQERVLGLEGQPRGQREKPAPADGDDDAGESAAAPQVGQPY